MATSDVVGKQSNCVKGAAGLGHADRSKTTSLVTLGAAVAIALAGLLWFAGFACGPRSAGDLPRDFYADTSDAAR